MSNGHFSETLHRVLYHHWKKMGLDAPSFSVVTLFFLCKVMWNLYLNLIDKELVGPLCNQLDKLNIAVGSRMRVSISC